MVDTSVCEIKKAEPPSGLMKNLWVPPHICNAEKQPFLGVENLQFFLLVFALFT